MIEGILTADINPLLRPFVNAGGAVPCRNPAPGGRKHFRNDSECLRGFGKGHFSQAAQKCPNARPPKS